MSHIAIVGPITSDSIEFIRNIGNTDLPPGHGGAPLLGTLIDALLARGHRLSVITTSTEIRPGDIQKHTLSSNHSLDLYYIGWRHNAFRRKNGFIGRGADLFAVERRGLENAIKTAAPDIIHAHWSYEFCLSALATDFPHLITCHDDPGAVIKYHRTLYRLARYFMARKCLSQAKYLTAVSPALSERIAKYSKRPVTTIQNPLPDWINNTSDTSRNDEAVMSEPRIVMVANGWDRLKNTKVGFQAFARFKKTHQNATFHVYGTGYGANDKVAEWLRTHNLEDGVHLHGRIPHGQLLNELRDTDVMIHPALEESCPMGIAEAMKVGLPIIGGKHSGGVPFVIGDGGILVDVTNPEDIHQALKKILENIDLYQSLSKKAYRRASTVFCASTVSALYEREYAKVISHWKSTT